MLLFSVCYGQKKKDSSLTATTITFSHPLFITQQEKIDTIAVEMIVSKDSIVSKIKGYGVRHFNPYGGSPVSIFIENNHYPICKEYLDINKQKLPANWIVWMAKTLK